MDYLARKPELRSRPGELLPGARSALCLATPYSPPSKELVPEGHGRVASYAWGRDYHNVLRKKLKKLVRIFTEQLAPGSRAMEFVDSGYLLERALARRAGLGFVGKNTMLISRRWGSYFFLSSILWTEELVPDEPVKPGCGSCRLCIDACPTGALVEPFRLDARRCLSYLTIEVRGAVPAGSPEKTGDWVFGCDECQIACPYNGRSWPSVGDEFSPAAGPGPTLPLTEIVAMDEATFRGRYSGTPLMRAKWEGMQRNARRILEERAVQGTAVDEGPASPASRDDQDA
jgi:epoxyqueuosine reductase